MQKPDQSPLPPRREALGILGGAFIVFESSWIHNGVAPVKDLLVPCTVCQIF